MPKLSLCMIVRNEAAMLGDCLASVQDIADEIIVVDTGSTDQTLSIAKSFGAKTASIVWNDDFAAARNVSLSMASGDFILLLDADERIVSSSAKAIRQFLTESNSTRAIIRLHDATSLTASIADVLSGKCRSGNCQHLARIYKKIPSLRFEGIIHEALVGEDESSPEKFIDCDIIHLGRVLQIVNERNKRTRNIQMLEKRCKSNPADVLAHGYLAYELVEMKEFRRAEQVVERIWSRLLRKEFSSWRGDPMSLHRLAVARMSLCIEMNRPKEILESASFVESVAGYHSDLDFYRANAHEILSLQTLIPSERTLHLENARKFFKQKIDRSKKSRLDDFVVGGEALVLTKLGDVEMALGNIEEAQRCFERVRVLNGDSRSIRLRIAECLVMLFQSKDALDNLESHLEHSPDTWLLIACAVEQMGMIDQMKEAFVNARRYLEEKPFESPYRNERFAEMMCRIATYSGAPIPGPGLGGTMGALLAGKELHPKAHMGPKWGERDVEMILMNVIRTGQSHLLNALLQPKAEQFVPGIIRIAIRMGILSEESN